jgi:hypothetical protein
MCYNLVNRFGIFVFSTHSSTVILQRAESMPESSLDLSFYIHVSTYEVFD